MGKKLTIRFLNVGQGDSAHLVLPDGKHMLIDINLDHKNRGIDVIQYLANELPKGKEKKKLDYLVNTHPHDDHIRGMGGVGNSFEIAEMWHPGHERDCEEGENDSYDKYVELLGDLEDKAKEVKASSDPWTTVGDVIFHVYRPSSYVKRDKDKSATENDEAIHNECMVLKVTYAGRSVMFTGDSNRKAWESIMTHYNDHGLLAAAVLSASHHGSRTFFKKNEEDDPYTDHLDAINPDAVVISAGADNPHGHPHKDALKLYGKRTIYRTDENLTVVLTIDEDGTMTWSSDDEDFQDKYQLPDPDENAEEDSNGARYSAWGGAPMISKTKLGDKSPTA